jgi:uncharacterized cysteine cluster protein YcgN (CxxCxxCC family)
LNLKQDDFTQFHWLPSTCAYRLLNDGKELPKWHPLVSGKAGSVKKAGVSIRRYAIKESIGMDLEDHIIEWLD